MNVTFDSNAWEQIISSKEEDNNAFSQLKMLIMRGKIKPYICEIALSIESIIKKDRMQFWAKYEPKFEDETISAINNADGTTTIHNRICFSPNNEKHPGLHPILKDKLDHANKLGFKILRMTNLGTVRTTEIPEEMYCHIDHIDDFWGYADKLSELSKFIEDMKCGSYAFFELKKIHGLQGYSIPRILKNVADKEHKNFAKAIAEWVDGEALSAHYAYGNDVFCSDDNARSAGRSSIFSKDNIDKLRDRYNLQITSTNQLVEKCSNK